MHASVRPPEGVWPLRAMKPFLKVLVK